MRWIDCLSGYAPDVTDRAGGVFMLGGSVVMGAGLTLASPPLYFGGVLVWLTGWGGSALTARKRARQPCKPPLSPAEEAEEDAAVDAAIHRLEAVSRFQAAAASQTRPPDSRLH